MNITFEGGPHAGLELNLPEHPPEIIVLGANIPLNDPALWRAFDGVRVLNVYDASDTEVYRYGIETFSFAPVHSVYIYEGTGQVTDALDLVGEGQG